MPQLTGNIVDLIRREIYPGTVTIADGRIARIDRFGNTPADDSRHNGSLPFLLPGFIDSHVHIESSMLSPDTALSPLWPILTKSRTSAGPMESGTWSNKPGVRR